MRKTDNFAAAGNACDAGAPSRCDRGRKVWFVWCCEQQGWIGTDPERSNRWARQKSRERHLPRRNSRSMHHCGGAGRGCRSFRHASGGRMARRGL